MLYLLFAKFGCFKIQWFSFCVGQQIKIKYCVKTKCDFLFEKKKLQCSRIVQVLSSTIVQSDFYSIELFKLNIFRIIIADKKKKNKTFQIWKFKKVIENFVWIIHIDEVGLRTSYAFESITNQFKRWFYSVFQSLFHLFFSFQFNNWSFHLFPFRINT